MKTNKYILVLILSLVCVFKVNSKSYILLISNDSKSPTPEAIVNQFNGDQPKPNWLLNSFSTYRPESVEYLIKNRPEGALLERITAYPDSNTAKMYRYLIVEYQDVLDNDNTILNQLQKDRSIEYASVNSIYEFPSVRTNKSTQNQTYNKSSASNYLVDLNIVSAWDLSEGMGYIGAMDVGLQLDHFDLMAFNGFGTYVGGNLLDPSNTLGFSYQEDVGDGGFNVDEKEPFYINNNPSLKNCDFDNDNYLVQPYVGHGTHVTGILVGKNHNVGGACKNCGMSMMRFAKTYCKWDFGAQKYLTTYIITEADIATSMNNLINLGIGTINYSGSYPKQPVEIKCDVPSNRPVCVAYETMLERNILLVASAGNYKVSRIDYPARDVGVVGVGGLDEFGGFWNDNQYGSNYSNNSTPIDQKTDVVTQAKNVYSTFYFGEEHNPNPGVDCTDISDGVIDGYGYCTGTSMSAPQVAGILQLMRSANPLIPNGTYDPNQKHGLINVLNATSSRSTSGLGIDNYFGYGLPDARLALETILGVSNETQMKTRLTPMFELYSSGSSNNVYTPFPQVAMSYLNMSSSFYTSSSSAQPVSEFQNFWHETNSGNYPAPRATFYVFTTNNNPFTGVKDMIPLRRMERTIGTNRNDTYIVNTYDIEDYRANRGYNFAGIEGYILPPCSPQPNCTIPNGSIELYRNTSDPMNHKLITSVGSSPPPNSVLLGYVYLNHDTDGDGLIDGQEIILGTNINKVDTDGDGQTDGEEYPPAGIPVSDPLIHPNDLFWLPAVVALVLS